jgi:hypothetical protein
MIFSVGFTYFYTTQQDLSQLQVAQRENNTLLSLKAQENLYVTASIGTGATLTFSVNNTGIASIIVAYFITDQSGNLVQYKTSTSTNPSACISTGASAIPCAINSGSSAEFDPSPAITYINGQTYTIRVITQRGTTVVGTYPTQQLSENSLSTLVASGLGSLEMIFSSFSFYNYSAGSPNWKVNLSSSQNAAITPFSKSIVMSAEVTNDDPSAGTIVVDSHTNLWTFLSCGSGCGTQAYLSFYVMDVASDGTITSTTYGSYVPLQIPYGATRTIYFGSSCDLSTSGCSYTAQSINDALGEHDVFMIFSGTLVSADNATLYSQNLPYAATFTSDNIATYNETPTTCANGSSTNFSLMVSNTNWSPSGDGINKVVVQAASFNPPTTQPTPPTGWTVSVNSGTITWTTTSEYIEPGQTLPFAWSGTAPVVSAGTQETFVSTASWNGGTVTSQPVVTGCFVG